MIVALKFAVELAGFPLMMFIFNLSFEPTGIK
jgi:hypothetical protein